MTEKIKKKFRYAEQDMLKRTRSDAFKVNVEIRVVKKVNQIVFACNVAKHMEYNGENVRVIAQLKDWKENYESNSPLAIEVDDPELEEFMKNFKFKGEPLAEGAFAALGKTPTTPDISDRQTIDEKAHD